MSQAVERRRRLTERANVMIRRSPPSAPNADRLHTASPRPVERTLDAMSAVARCPRPAEHRGSRLTLDAGNPSALGAGANLAGSADYTRSDTSQPITPASALGGGRGDDGRWIFFSIYRHGKPGRFSSSATWLPFIAVLAVGGLHHDDGALARLAAGAAVGVTGFLRRLTVPSFVGWKRPPFGTAGKICAVCLLGGYVQVLRATPAAAFDCRTTTGLKGMS